MGMVDWRTVIEKDFPAMGEVTSETLEEVEREAGRYRGGVRISTARIWIDAEFEERRRKVLATELP
ncbi:MAG: hypothetical protein NTW96_26275 [Planctomycetia bacterium]|nr:hypothetical protein [Planctomycetia bacterium]